MRRAVVCLGVVTAALVGGCGSGGSAAPTGVLTVTVREVNMPTRSLPDAPLGPTRGYVYVTTSSGQQVVHTGIDLLPVLPQPSTSRAGVIKTRVAAGHYIVQGGLLVLTIPSCPKQSVKVNAVKASDVTVTCDASRGG